MNDLQQLKKILKNKSFLKNNVRFWIYFFVISNVVLLAIFVFFITILHSQALLVIPSGQKNTIPFSYFQTRPDLYASSRALVVYDADMSQIILSKNENLRFSPASTAKIMASLVILDEFELSDVLTYDEVLITPDHSKMGLFIGENISIKNLLYGMMLPSGNDAAKLISKSYPGGEEAFVLAMNNKAKNIGMTNTYFVDPAGYKDENYSTAYDLALLGAYALTNKTLAEIVRTPAITVTDITGNIKHNLKNLNELLSIDGVNGIKTGFTNEAEGVLVTSFSHNLHTYIIVVLRSNNRFQDTKDVIQGVIGDLKRETYSL